MLFILRLRVTFLSRPFSHDSDNPNLPPPCPPLVITQRLILKRLPKGFNVVRFTYLFQHRTNPTISNTNIFPRPLLIPVYFLLSAISAYILDSNAPLFSSLSVCINWLSLHRLESALPQPKGHEKDTPPHFAQATNPN